MSRQEFTTRKWFERTSVASLVLGTLLAPRGYKFLVPLAYFIMIAAYVCWRLFSTQKPRSLTLEEEWQIADYQTENSATSLEGPENEKSRR